MKKQPTDHTLFLFRLHLENGQTVSIAAHGDVHRNRYIDSMTVDGAAYDRNYLTHSALLGGADIRLRMSPRPNHTRGTAPEAAPYSFSTETKTGKR